MKTDPTISLNFDQIMQLVKQLSRAQKIRLAKELEQEAINSQLISLLNAFHTDELSQELIDTEVEAARSQLYEQSQKH